MSWAAVISAILAILGPVLMDLLKEWLDGLLNRAKHRLPSQASTDLYASENELWDAALQIHEEDGQRLWWWQWWAKSRHARRTRFLQRSRDITLASAAEGRAPTATEEHELRSLATAAA